MTLNVPSTVFRTGYDSTNPPQLHSWRVRKTEYGEKKEPVSAMRFGILAQLLLEAVGIEPAMIKLNQSWLAEERTPKL